MRAQAMRPHPDASRVKELALRVFVQGGSMRLQEIVDSVRRLYADTSTEPPGMVSLKRACDALRDDGCLLENIDGTRSLTLKGMREASKDNPSQVLHG